MLVVNEDPISYYREFSPFIQHMHIKDIDFVTNGNEYADISADGKCMISCPHFEGQVDFDALFKEFALGKYNGTMALEYAARDDIEYGDDFKRLYKKFTQLQAKYAIGVNQFGLIGELMSEPTGNVWKKIADLGFHSIEGCAIIDSDPKANEIIRRETEEKGVMIPPVISRENEISDFVAEVRKSGLLISSLHLFACDVYAGYLTNIVPAIINISRETGIDQFVVSLMMRDLESARAYEAIFRMLQRNWKKRALHFAIIIMIWNVFHCRIQAF